MSSAETGTDDQQAVWDAVADLSPQMIQLADQRPGDLENLTFQVLDAQQMELADESIDLRLQDGPDAVRRSRCSDR